MKVLIFIHHAVVV